MVRLLVFAVLLSFVSYGYSLFDLAILSDSLIFF